jgi:hypothetical protein
VDVTADQFGAAPLIVASLSTSGIARAQMK